MPGEGDPETLRPARQPVHGCRLRRVLQDGGRAGRYRGVHHPAARGRRSGHRAGQPRPPGRRRPHRAQLRPGAARDHRGQRRLRPHQTPAAVPVLAAALTHLQRHLLFAVEAQQRGEHVHQRQLCRQHGHQGPGRARAVDPGRLGRADHVRHRAHGRLCRRVGQRSPPYRRHAGAVLGDHQRRPAPRRTQRGQHPRRWPRLPGELDQRRPRHRARRDGRRHHHRPVRCHCAGVELHV